MQRSTLLFLRFSLVLLMVSCGAYRPDATFREAMPKKDVFQNRYFDNAQADYVYKANISVYGNELTGILIVKKTAETTHRVVFTTEFGNKLFDFELSPNHFQLNHIVEELNRPIILRTLENDFRLLLQRDIAVAAQFENEPDHMYKSPAKGPLINYFFVNKLQERLYQILQTTRTKEKIKISITAENNIFAQNIVIQHYDIKLRMVLNHFKEN